MHSQSHADPVQIAVLVAALDRYCRDKGIASDSPDRETVASVVWALFENGARTPEQFDAELAQLHWPHER
ncbi:hypothetical protein PLCT1_00108 [Planctomycetaceae bacterium]|nr:hypothetical protein PLCT1_00108 [Planctomycetaceae bacterium]